MIAPIAAMVVLLVGGVASLLSSHRRSAAVVTWLGSRSAVVGCFLAFPPVVETLAGRTPTPLHFAWSLPGANFALAIDGLAAVCLLPVLILGVVTAWYAAAYLDSHSQDSHRLQLGVHWLCFNLLLASMILVVLAANGLLFLLAWEVMALSSYFLVNLESERREVQQAGFTYLVATHLGTGFLIALFAIFGAHAGSLDFADWSTPPPAAGALFLLALVGFGAKAGIVPLHIWLPEAHPAAPSHVSALMSGAMIKTGIYGLLRFLGLLGPPEKWWGVVLIVAGLGSGVFGVLFALAQHDLKRLLAYHSIENIGIITVGIGLGVLGVANNMPTLAALGFAGALLHTINHALFKGLLFLGSGALLRATGTREIDQLGGILGRMPVTGACFLVGAASISALPGLNGFVSEFLIYLGAFGAAGSNSSVVVIAAVASLALLGLIGGLAVACFTKAFGTVFLGQPRSACALRAQPAPHRMRMAMVALGVCCVAVGLCPGPIVGLLAPAIGVVSLLPHAQIAAGLAPATVALNMVALLMGGFLLLLACLTMIRAALLHGRRVESEATWDCGYTAPTPRMQYSASSFAQPLVTLMAPVLRTRTHETPPSGLFPDGTSFASHTPDLFRSRVFEPLFCTFARLARSVRWLQNGSVQVYVAYIVLTIAALLFWGLRGE